MAPALVARPGRPRDVHGTWWWIDHGDGTVSYVILRRTEGGSPNGLTLAFHGADDAEALARHDEWRAEQYERVTRGAERRAKWGPLELRERNGTGSASAA